MEIFEVKIFLWFWSTKRFACSVLGKNTNIFPKWWDFNGDESHGDSSVESATKITSKTKSSGIFSSPQSRPNRANESNQENPHTPQN